MKVQSTFNRRTLKTHNFLSPFDAGKNCKLSFCLAASNLTEICGRFSVEGEVAIR